MRCPNDAPAAARAAAAVRAHCEALIDAAGPACVAVKPQLARFEQLGAAGREALGAVCEHARAAGLLVIADAKRGDIDVTAAAYARALFGGLDTPFGAVAGLGVDMATINPLMGSDALAPFIATAGESRAGVLVLVRTSNPGAADIEDLRLAGTAPDAGTQTGIPKGRAAGGEYVWERIATLVDELGREQRGGERPQRRRCRRRRHRARAYGARSRTDAQRRVPAARRGRARWSRRGSRPRVRAGARRRPCERVAIDRTSPPCERRRSGGCGAR